MVKLYENVIQRGGGLFSVGKGLGVWVMPDDCDPAKAPPGWGVIRLSEATPERIERLVESVKTTTGK